MKHNSAEKSGVFTKLLIWLVNPFVAFLSAFFSLKQRGAYFILYLWFFLFGVAFVAKNESADSYRYVEKFQDYRLETPAELHDYVVSFFQFNSIEKDIYTQTAFFLIGGFTSNYHYLFALFALVFGFFYVKSLKFMDPRETEDQWFFYSLLFLFCFSNPIFNINGVRFWTASWVAVYATFKIFVDNDRRFYALSLCTFLIHGAFLMYVALLLVNLFFGRFERFWSILFYLACFVSAGEILGFVRDFTDLLPTFMQQMFVDYSSQVKEYSSSDIHYNHILNAIPNFYMLVAVALLIINRDRLGLNGTDRRLFQFTLILFTFINVTSSVPSVGVRFRMTAIPFIAYLWLRSSKEMSRYRSYILLAPVAYSYLIWYWLRNVISISELYLYVAPAPYTIVHYLS